MSRIAAAATLWEGPDAQTNLRQLLLRMRKACPTLHQFLAQDEKSVGLVNPQLTIDAVALFHWPVPATPDDLQFVLDHFHGALLEGIKPPGREFVHQIAIDRERLQGRFFNLIEQGLKEVNRYGAMPLQLLQKTEQVLLTADPQREESYRTLIKAYGEVGHGVDAQRIFALLSNLRKRDGEPPPALETRVSLQLATAPVIAHASTAGLRPTVNSSVILPRVALLAPSRSTEDQPGMTHWLIEDVANNLARYRSFVTLASHSSFHTLHDGGIPLDNSLLRADYTVSSFVREGAGGKPELCLRLVSCHEQSILWSGEYSIAAEALIATTRNLVSRIAFDLADAVERSALRQLERTRDPSAYLQYLRGQDALRTSDLKSFRRARRFFLEAIKDDPNFAEAYSGIANTLHWEWVLRGGNDARLLTEAGEAAAIAISKDRSSSSGYWRQANVKLYRHDFDGAEEDFLAAQERHPNSSRILLDRSDALGHIGDANVAWELFQRALDLNPNPPDHFWWVGASIAFSQSDYSKCVQLCGKLVDDEPVIRLLASAHGNLGNKEEARSYGQRVREAHPGQSAESMTALQPHRTKASLQTFIEGLRLAGIN